jgi:hypothetical protein
LKQTQNHPMRRQNPLFFIHFLSQTKNKIISCSIKIISSTDKFLCSFFILICDNTKIIRFQNKIIWNRNKIISCSIKIIFNTNKIPCFSLIAICYAKHLIICSFKITCNTNKILCFSFIFSCHIKIILCWVKNQLQHKTKESAAQSKSSATQT